MPVLTIASAIWRISVSLMLQPKVFQVFQPIGGVRATPLSSAWAVSWSDDRVGRHRGERERQDADDGR